MILTAFHIIVLFGTAFKLGTFCPRGHRYRFFISLIATLWAGMCAALGVAMLLAWPDAVDKTNAVTAALAGLSMAAAWSCGGNVAELIRMIRRYYYNF